ncbi:MAG: diacylglycerol kinase family protein [Solirubrobacterales bacterium]
MDPLKPLALIVNPSAGGGRVKELLPRVEKALDERRMAFRVERTGSREHAADEVLRAAESDEVPVVMSGDGLVGLAGGLLAGSDVPLGIVPAGRGNDLARVLGIPTDPTAAVETLRAGTGRRIDVGEANDERFLCIASIGFDSEANRIANEARLVRGNLVYAYAALRALAGWKPARFTIKVGEQQRRFTGYSVSAANTQAYGGGMFLAPDADPSDGEFDIVLVGEVSRLRFLLNLPKVFKGTHVRREEVRVFRSPELELDASRPFAVYADGEHITDTPVSLRILPSALTVIVPQPGA